MMERDWNHPSVIAWSVGNEFAADTPAGIAWVKEMVAFTRGLDAARPVTFVSNTVSKASLKAAAEEGSAFVDFVCLNTYGRTPRENAANIDRAHALHPGKPLLVTEYGIRHDFVGDETERIDWFREMLAVVRARPFVSGLSVWSLNDYRSRYVGTNPNGWREWGLVAPDRTPRGAYHALRREHGGIVLESARMAAGKLTIRFAPRTDFPLFPPAELELRVAFADGQNRPVSTLTAPLRTDGPMEFAVPAGAGLYRLEVWRGGFRTATFGAANAPAEDPRP
jgi:beta-glucuronidase